jgi:hypothetical protein
MKRNDWLTVTSVAVVTAALTILSNYGGSLNAGADNDQPAPRIENPMWLLHGVELTVQAKDRRAFKAGDQPEFEFKAVNTTDKPATLAVNVDLLSTPEINRLSRTMPVPTSVWREPRTFTLAPKETKSMAIATKTELAANKMFSVTLKEVGTDIQPFLRTPSPDPVPRIARIPYGGFIAMSFSTVAPKATAETAPIVAAR